MIRARIISFLLVSCTVCSVMTSGDPVTITGNTFGDLVNVNVNVSANIQNEINQDYVNVLALLLSSTGDVELFRQLSRAVEETAPTTVAPTTDEKGVPAHPKENINIEEALRKLFPNLAKKQ